MARENEIAKAIRQALTSGNLMNGIGCEANIIDVASDIDGAIRKLARAITADAAAGRDSRGGHVESLTEAVMGITAALDGIAEAINNLAESVRERKS